MSLLLIVYNISSLNAVSSLGNRGHLYGDSEKNTIQNIWKSILCSFIVTLAK